MVPTALVEYIKLVKLNFIYLYFSSSILLNIIVNNLMVAILSSLNCMLSIYHLCLRLGLDIEDSEIKGVSNLIER